MKFFVDQSLELSLGFLNAIVTLGSFVGILWGLSGPLEISLNGNPVAVQGYMVWAALFYAILGTWLTHQIGKRLIGLNLTSSASKQTSGLVWSASGKMRKAWHCIRESRTNLLVSAPASQASSTTGGAS